MTATYDDGFFDLHREGALRSAGVIVPLVMDLVTVRSVVDVGCGSGSWLAAFMERGVEDVLGIDGDYVNRDRLDIPADRFLAADLEQPLAIHRRFDLATCLEVGEHLAPERADPLVETLTGLAPVVLFSAAIPFQGGSGHVNEQWPEYWASRFAARGFRVFDPIRHRVWESQGVEFWYAQNLLLYVAESHLAADPGLGSRLEAARGSPLPLVHPRLFGKTAERLQEDHEKALFFIAESDRLKNEVAHYREVAEHYFAEFERLRKGSGP